MTTEFAVTLAVIGLTAFVLHLKSHIKFIALGAFVGLVLAETVGRSLQRFLSTNVSSLQGDTALTVAQLVLLLVPTVILGINHSVDKKRENLVKKVLLVIVTTLFLLSSVVAYLPEEVRRTVLERSVVAANIHYFRVWLLIAVAAILILDSFHHKAHMEKEKAKKKLKK